MQAVVKFAKQNRKKNNKILDKYKHFNTRTQLTEIREKIICENRVSLLI